MVDIKPLEVKDIIKKLADNTIDNPEEISNYLVIITADSWRYGKDKIEKDILQAKKWAEIRLNCKTDSQADKMIKTTPEWKDWQMTIITERTIIELIRSLKARLKSFTEELKNY